MPIYCGKEIEEAQLENQATDSISKLQAEAAEAANRKFHEVQQSLEDTKKVHDEVISNLQATEAKGREVLEALSSRRPSFEIDPEELERRMNMPEEMDDSFAFLREGWDAKKHSKSRRSPIMVLEELGQNLKNLLCTSEEVLPMRRAKSSVGGRRTSIMARQMQRDPIEEEILSEIRGAY